MSFCELVERVADGELRGDLRDRVPGGLRGERARARETRGFISMTSIRPSFGSTANCTLEPPVSTPISRHDRARRVAQALVLAVGQRHRRRDRDRVARVNAHRVDVLDRADDDEVVVPVADDLELELLPAEHALLDEHLVRRRLRERPGDLRVELGRVVRDAAAGAAERERRAEDGREPDVLDDRARLVDRVRERATRGHSRPICSIAALNSARSSAFAIDAGRRAEQLDAVACEDAAPRARPSSG